MTANLPPEDQPSGKGLIAASLEDASADLAAPFESPGGTAAAFLLALTEGVANYRTALLNLTTPESHGAWGTFELAAQMVADLGEWGLGTRGQRSAQDDDVAYVAVLRDVEQPMVSDGDTLVNAACIVSLVKRPAVGGWLVHAFGEGYFPAEDMPKDDL